MITSVFGKSVWERRRSTLLWTLGMVFLAAVTVSFFPTIRNDSESFQEMFESMPEGVLSIFGIDDTTLQITPSGFVNTRLYSGIGAVALAVFGLGLGTSAIVGEEERGTLNLLLAQPISRTRVVLEKFAASVLTTAVVGSGVLLTLVVFNPIVDLEFAFLNMVAANVGLVLMSLVFCAFALMVGALTGDRGKTSGLSAALVVLAFFVNGLAPLVESIAWTRQLSPFYWLQGPNRLSEGFNARYSSVMVLVILAQVMIAVWGLNRRDIDV